jgi:hypothetical protein
MSSYQDMFKDPQWVQANLPQQPTRAGPSNIASPDANQNWHDYMMRARAQTQALNQAPGMGIPGQTGNMTPESYEERFKQLQTMFSKIGGLGGLGGLFNAPEAKKTPEELAKEQYYIDQMDPNTPAYR